MELQQHPSSALQINSDSVAGLSSRIQPQFTIPPPPHSSVTNGTTNQPAYSNGKTITNGDGITSMHMMPSQHTNGWTNMPSQHTNGWTNMPSQHTNGPSIDVQHDQGIHGLSGVVPSAGKLLGVVLGNPGNTTMIGHTTNTVIGNGDRKMTAPNSTKPVLRPTLLDQSLTPRIRVRGFTPTPSNTSQTNSKDRYAEHRASLMPIDRLSKPMGTFKPVVVPTKALTGVSLGNGPRIDPQKGNNVSKIQAFSEEGTTHSATASGLSVEKMPHPVNTTQMTNSPEKTPLPANETVPQKTSTQANETARILNAPQAMNGPEVPNFAPIMPAVGNVGQLRSQPQSQTESAQATQTSKEKEKKIKTSSFDAFSRGLVGLQTPNVTPRLLTPRNMTPTLQTRPLIAVQIPALSPRIFVGEDSTATEERRSYPKIATDMGINQPNLKINQPIRAGGPSISDRWSTPSVTNRTLNTAVQRDRRSDSRMAEINLQNNINISHKLDHLEGRIDDQKSQYEKYTRPKVFLHRLMCGSNPVQSTDAKPIITAGKVYSAALSATEMRNECEVAAAFTNPFATTLTKEDIAMPITPPFPVALYTYPAFALGKTPDCGRVQNIYGSAVFGKKSDGAEPLATRSKESQGRKCHLKGCETGDRSVDTDVSATASATVAIHEDDVIRVVISSTGANPLTSQTGSNPSEGDQLTTTAAGNPSSEHAAGNHDGKADHDAEFHDAVEDMQEDDVRNLCPSPTVNDLRSDLRVPFETEIPQNRCENEQTAVSKDGKDVIKSVSNDRPTLLQATRMPDLSMPSSGTKSTGPPDGSVGTVPVGGLSVTAPIGEVSNTAPGQSCKLGDLLSHNRSILSPRSSPKALPRDSKREFTQFVIPSSQTPLPFSNTALRSGTTRPILDRFRDPVVVFTPRQCREGPKMFDARRSIVARDEKRPSSSFHRRFGSSGGPQNSTQFDKGTIPDTVGVGAVNAYAVVALSNAEMKSENVSGQQIAIEKPENVTKAREEPVSPFSKMLSRLFCGVQKAEKESVVKASVETDPLATNCSYVGDVEYTITSAENSGTKSEAVQRLQSTVSNSKQGHGNASTAATTLPISTRSNQLSLGLATPSSNEMISEIASRTGSPHVTPRPTNGLRSPTGAASPLNMMLNSRIYTAPPPGIVRPVFHTSCDTHFVSYNLPQVAPTSHHSMIDDAKYDERVNHIDHDAESTTGTSKTTTPSTRTPRGSLQTDSKRSMWDVKAATNGMSTPGADHPNVSANKSAPIVNAQGSKMTNDQHEDKSSDMQGNENNPSGQSNTGLTRPRLMMPAMHLISPITPRHNPGESPRSANGAVSRAKAGRTKSNAAVDTNNDVVDESDLTQREAKDQAKHLEHTRLLARFVLAQVLFKVLNRGLLSNSRQSEVV